MILKCVLLLNRNAAKLFTECALLNLLSCVIMFLRKVQLTILTDWQSTVVQHDLQSVESVLSFLLLLLFSLLIQPPHAGCLCNVNRSVLNVKSRATEKLCALTQMLKSCMRKFGGFGSLNDLFMKFQLLNLSTNFKTTRKSSH